MIIILGVGSGNVQAEGDLHKVMGYSEDVTDFTVSNVVETFDASTIDIAFDAGLVAEIPVEIVVENEGGSSFGTYRLKMSEDGLYGYNPEEQLKVSGEVSAMVPMQGAKKNIFGKYDPDLLEEATIDIEDLENFQYQELEYLPGAKTVIDEPGEYYVMFRIKGTMGATEAFLKVIESEEAPDALDEMFEAPEMVEAIPSNTRILLDGEEISFDAYNIEGNNFFKLRDLAYALNQSQKEFDVNWIEEDRTIEILGGRPYTLVGGEMESRDSVDSLGLINNDPVIFNSEEIDLLAYNIGGNNYFKLRDIAGLIDFGVTWDAESRTIEIKTENSYVEEIPQKQIF
jgi:hypothetical protein